MQRAESLLLVGLLSAGFGATSADVLDASTMQTAQLAGSVLMVAHVFIAGFGAFSASQAAKENPVAWFFKILLSGAGGFAELRGRLQ